MPESSFWYCVYPGFVYTDLRRGNCESRISFDTVIKSKISVLLPHLNELIVKVSRDLKHENLAESHYGKTLHVNSKIGNLKNPGV